jgi:hypothetical protein
VQLQVSKRVQGKVQRGSGLIRECSLECSNT